MDALTTGHGTANDFVLILDPVGEAELSAARVALLADRRRGIGGDGVIRVVRSSELGEAAGDAAHADGAEWFMDYRNADGSIAEMCGNGVRVFAHYLVQRGLVDGEAFPVGTRAGTKYVQRIADPLGGTADWYRVDMGKFLLPSASSDGADALVETPGIRVARPALSVDMGNPHTVLALASLDELAAAELTGQPRVTPDPPEGTNIEYIVIAPDEHGSLHMRVHERGVGETFACGTGACAAAVAARFWAGDGAPNTWFVEQPGGTVRIEIEGQRTFLSGPAVLTADVVPSRELAEALRELGGTESQSRI